MYQCNLLEFLLYTVFERENHNPGVVSTVHCRAGHDIVILVILLVCPHEIPDTVVATRTPTPRRTTLTGATPMRRETAQPSRKRLPKRRVHARHKPAAN